MVEGGGGCGGGEGEENEKEKPMRRITAEELRAHNKPSDLWISIQGKVYDVTEWVGVHPGGDIPIIDLAGQDITDAFVAYHPASAWSVLGSGRVPFVGYLADHRVSAVSRDYRRLAGEFSRMGLFDKKGHTTAAALGVMAAMFAAVVYGIVRSESAWVHLGCAVLMGFLWMQSGFLGHDSGHYPVTGNRTLNCLMQVVVGNCLTGISIGWWKHNHNVHHIACNSLDFDPDVQHIPLFAVSAELFRSLTSTYYHRRMNFDSVARFFVSYQHWTFYPVMAVARVNLYVQSFLLLLSKERVSCRRLELAGLAFYWIWYPLLVAQLPGWGERLAFVLMSFAVTGIQHVQFCLNHFSASVYVGPPTANDWFERQTQGTLDIKCSPWMDWFHGGLQFQVEHHLFPRLPRGQLRRISPLVKELCAKHGLPYSSFSFWEANVRTIRTLRAAALLARDRANPVPKNLVWEAVNHHG